MPLTCAVLLGGHVRVEGANQRRAMLYPRFLVTISTGIHHTPNSKRMKRDTKDVIIPVTILYNGGIGACKYKLDAR